MKVLLFGEFLADVETSEMLPDVTFLACDDARTVILRGAGSGLDKKHRHRQMMIPKEWSTYQVLSVYSTARTIKDPIRLLRKLFDCPFAFLNLGL